MPHENPSSLNVLKQPVCRHLLSKGMYVTGHLDPADDIEGHSDGHCWCNRTAGMLGPDDQLVDRQRCGPGRTCYEPRF
jgi:hypothetical protein